MTCTIYKLKPLLELTDDIEIKSPMYYMKNIQNSTDSDLKVINNNGDILNEIESEQQLLRREINEVKGILTSIKQGTTFIESPNSTILRNPRMSARKPDLLKVGIIHDVVLNANYKKPPFSLLAINKIWPDILNINFNCHVHSSVTVLPKNLNIFENLTNSSDFGAKKLRVRVVWKEMTNDCELIISPFTSVPLVGEVNFLRFFHNVICPPSSDLFEQTLFHVKLDICHSLYFIESSQQLQECLKTLSEGLDHTQWMFGDDLTVVDLAAWSALKNIKKTNLSGPLSKWFQQCELFLKT